MIFKYLFYLALILFVGVLVSSSAHASDFNILPIIGNFNIQEEISVDIRIDTVNETINAAQGKLKFDPNILTVKSLSKEGSIFNFWLGDPKFSNTEGTIEFTGGVVNGVSGHSLQILKIVFITKGAGSSDVSFSSASIAASDGKGTNVLNKSNGAKYAISSVVSVPKGEATPSPTAPIQAPVQIKRTAIQATNLPVLPIISVPLYPNPANWYSFVSQFVASWKLSSDISGLNTALSVNPNFVVPPISEGLFESKTFPEISKSGVYYFHVRFQNNVGWGPTAHYRIAVDTQPPLPFKINVPTGLISDDPSPILVFDTGDVLSGVDYYVVRLNSEEPIKLTADEKGAGYKIAPHPPGVYTVRVGAFDRAGNSIEDNVKIEILPIKTPIINFINQKIIIGSDSFLNIKGLSLPDTSIVVTIEDDDGRLVLQDEGNTNDQGVWEFRLDRDLRRGDYFVTVRAKDSRGAMSFPTSPMKISYSDKVVASLFGFGITLMELFNILVVCGVLTIAWFYRKTFLHLARSQREAIIISRDIKNAFNIIREDLSKISGTAKKDSSVITRGLEVDSITNKIKDTLDKVEKYSSEDIERLK